MRPNVCVSCTHFDMLLSSIADDARVVFSSLLSSVTSMSLQMARASSQKLRA